MRVQELVRHLEDDGWLDVKPGTEARQLSHAQRPALVTIVGDERTEIPAGTLRAVFAPVRPVEKERT